jgi:hypothetical protein
VGYGYVIANSYRPFLIGAMDDDPILDVHIVADTDVMHIATHHGVEPNAAVIAHFHFANNSSIFSYETVFAKFRGEAFYGIDEGHGFLSLEFEV